MASSSAPRILSFIADSSIAKGKAVKIASGYSVGHVRIGAANTDKCIGIAQNEATASGDLLEVAIIGGGAKALLGETVSKGQSLVSNTDGSLVKANASGDKIVALCMESGVSGDLVDCEIFYASALAADE